MAWQIELSEGAVKNIKQIDHQHARRILNFLHGRVVNLMTHAALARHSRELWKYRMGDYRIIADIENGVMLVLVLKVGNRHEVYLK